MQRAGGALANADSRMEDGFPDVVEHLLDVRSIYSRLSKFDQLLGLLLTKRQRFYFEIQRDQLLETSQSDSAFGAKKHDGHRRRTQPENSDLINAFKSLEHSNNR